MCGIAGIWDRGGKIVDPSRILPMRDALAHRGPDDQGVYVDKNIALAHTRLSILDLSPAGAQPFKSSDGRYILTFNGEIYNYKALQEKYLDGMFLRSTSDTEVLLEVLIKMGPKVLPELRGMFAFCFYDTDEESMLLACDAFGKKPLFYATINDVFIFASEPKALLLSEYITSKLDESSVGPYLMHEYCPQPMTGYQQIYSLGAGEYMDSTRTSTRIVQWWKPNVTPKTHMSFSRACKQFDDVLGRAVERRMIADVPVGIFLSGGLDSSSIAWYMRDIKKQSAIHSCSVSFADDSFNEAHFASRVASRLGFTHHDVEFSQDVFLESLTELVPLLDIPFADPSIVPTYAVSKLAKQYVAVVLDGDGSDELLGGYGTFQAYELAQSLRRVPQGAWRNLASVVQSVIPVSHAYFSFDFKVKSFLRGVAYMKERSIQTWLGAFTPSEIREILISDFDNEFAIVDGIVPPEVTHSFDRASLYHLNAYMQKDIVVKIDRATMAVGLEARTPFLDIDVVEFALRLPIAYKRNKRILREVMKGRLPDEIISRKKQGFGIPISSWFSESLLPFVENILSPDRIDRAGVFRYSVIRIIIDEHARGVFDHRKKLWTLIMFQLWHEYWIQRQGATLQSGVPPQISK